MKFSLTSGTNKFLNKTNFGTIVFTDKEFTIACKDLKLSLKDCNIKDLRDDFEFEVSGMLGRKHSDDHTAVVMSLRTQNQEDLKSLLWVLAEISTNDERSKRRIAQRYLRRAFDPKHPVTA